MASPPYCGDMALPLRGLGPRDPSGGIPALFAGRRMAWTFNTRVAIRAACDLLGLEPGDEVLAPAYNCGSEIDPLVAAGLAVPLYPVGDDLVADPDRIAALIGPRTRAIYVIHYFGILQPRLHEIRALADARGLRIIEDCALSLLSGTAPAEGRTGDVAVFCLHKFLPSGTGGALVVNAPDLPDPPAFTRAPPVRRRAKAWVRAAMDAGLGPARAAALRSRRRRPAAPPRPAAGLADIPGHYYFDPALERMGIAALALRIARAADPAAVAAARRGNWTSWEAALEGLDGARPLIPALPADACPVCFPVVVPDRDRIAAALQARGIGATPWWAGFHRGVDWTGQNSAMALKNSVLALPLHQFLSEGAIARILGILESSLS